MGDLTLTIWTPRPDGRARPVLVWLHGGAFISGAGSLDWYDGSILAREGDIVVVGVNYRLGALGCLCRPGVSDGNLGTLDQLAAPCWVRQHIRGFGGDPVCITLARQSAGAAAIGALIAMPEARSLVRLAILQSSGFGRSPRNAADAAAVADRLLARLGIDPERADAPARLLSVPAAEIVIAQGQVAHEGIAIRAWSSPRLLGSPATPTRSRRSGVRSRRVP